MRIWYLTSKSEIEYYASKRFAEDAEERGIDFSLVFPEDFEIFVNKEQENELYYKGKPAELPDALIPRMDSGTTYFAFAIIRHLTNRGVLVLNSADAIKKARDKLESLQLMSNNNIPVPKSMLAKFPIDLKLIETEFKYPILLKTVLGSRGKGVFLCEKRSRLTDVMDLIEISKNPDVNVILQEFVSESKGKDIRVFVIGGRPIGAIMRKADRGKYKTHSENPKIEEVKLNPRIEWLASESAHLMGLEIAGVDLLFDGDNYRICEINSVPGLKGIEKGTKLNIPKEVFNYIRARLGEKTPTKQKA